jgi:hypothetical protein
MPHSKLLVLCFLALTAFSSRAEERLTVTAGEVTCQLPYGWHQVENPKTIFAAAPRFNNDRLFAVAADPAAACPIPCAIDDESDYEKAYWNKYEQNFSRTSHSQITSRDFRIINGTPYRIFDAEREPKPGTTEKILLETLSTPGNGKIYCVLLMKKGKPPGADPDLQALTQSVAFVSPLHIAWYQHLIHQSSNLIGLPLLLVAIGLGIYLLSISGNELVPFGRKTTVCSSGMAVAMLNAFWIAGVNSIVGIISLLLLGAFILGLQRFNKKAQALRAAGKIPKPAPNALKKRFWFMGVAALFGIATADAQQAYSGASLQFIDCITLFTSVLIALIFWLQYRKLSAQPTQPSPPVDPPSNSAQPQR